MEVVPLKSEEGERYKAGFLSGPEIRRSLQVTIFICDWLEMCERSCEHSQFQPAQAPSCIAGRRNVERAATESRKFRSDHQSKLYRESCVNRNWLRSLGWRGHGHSTKEGQRLSRLLGTPLGVGSYYIVSATLLKLSFFPHPYSETQQVFKNSSTVSAQNGLLLYIPSFSGIDSIADAKAIPFPSCTISVICVM